MKILDEFVDFKGFLLAGSAVIAFSHFVYVLFGYTIPAIIIESFKEFGAAIVMLSVFVFAVTWLLRAKPSKKPQNYAVVVYDIFGNESKMEGLRTDFKTHDVAWSFMKQYKKLYPLCNFAMVSELPHSEKRTIFKYI